MEISYSAGGTLVTIEFDATPREQHTASATPTEHPVEKGPNVSDHVRPELDKLTVDVHVTNTPTRVPGSNLDGARGSVSPVTLNVDVLEPTTSTKSIDVPTRPDIPKILPGVGLIAGSGLLDSTTTVKVQTHDTRLTKASATANVLQFDSVFDRVRSIYDELLVLKDAGTLLTIDTTLRQYENMVLRNVSAPRRVEDGNAVTFTLDFQQIRFATAKRVPAPKTKMAAQKKNLGAKPTTTTEKTQEEISAIYKLAHPSP